MTVRWATTVGRTRMDVTLHGDMRERQHFDYWQILARDPDSGRITPNSMNQQAIGAVLDDGQSRADAFIFRADHLGVRSLGSGA